MQTTIGLILFVILTACAVTRPAPLPSWSEGTSKQQIIDFVNSVTKKEGSDYVAPGKRIATFDNDGTLWAEKPTYFQFLFIIDRIKTMAPDHPEWASTQPFQAVLENDMVAIKAAGEHGAFRTRHGHACRHDHGRI